MLTALVSITAKKENPMEKTTQKLIQLIDYAETHIDAIIIYHASDMVLEGHIDDSYLSEKNPEEEQRGIYSCQTAHSSFPTMEQF